MKSDILIAEGSAYMRIMLKDQLAKSGFNVIGEAENGDDAIRLYTKLNPDLIILDVQLQGTGGLEVIKDIREADPEAKIIAIGAIGQQELVAEAMKNGADDFFVKPFETETVNKVLKKLL